MKEQLEQYVKRVKELYELCDGNEATTKASLIAPLFTVLGYDMADPHECLPEYRANFGKGEKAATPVDWAFRLSSTFAFIVEAKDAGSELKPYAEQLGMYFAKAGVNLGILTNGIRWQFYTDMAKANLMDTEPFFTWDVLKDDPSVAVDLLTILQKTEFSRQRIRTFAEKKYHQTLLVGILKRLLEPSSEFVDLALRTPANDSGDTLVSGNITQKVIGDWKPILKDAIHEWAKQHDLTIALQHPKPEMETESTHDDDEPFDPDFTVGTILTRSYKGQEIKVKVTADGFEWNGESFKSLTAVAKKVTGYPSINGRAFFAKS